MNRPPNPIRRAWQAWTENLDFVAILAVVLLLAVVQPKFQARWTVSGAMWSEIENTLQFCRDAAPDGESGLKVILH